MDLLPPPAHVLAQVSNDAWPTARLSGTLLLVFVVAFGVIGLMVVLGLLHAWRKSVSRPGVNQRGPARAQADAWSVAGQRLANAEADEPQSHTDSAVEDFEDEAEDRVGDCDEGRRSDQSVDQNMDHGLDHGLDHAGDDPDPLARRGEWLGGGEDQPIQPPDDEADPTVGGPQTFDTGTHFDDGYEDDTGPDTGEDWKLGTEYAWEDDDLFADDDAVDGAITESLAEDDPFAAYRQPPDELKGLPNTQDDDGVAGGDDDTADGTKTG